MSVSITMTKVSKIGFGMLLALSCGAPPVLSVEPEQDAFRSSALTFQGDTINIAVARNLCFPRGDITISFTDSSGMLMTLQSFFECRSALFKRYLNVPNLDHLEDWELPISLTGSFFTLLPIGYVKTPADYSSFVSITDQFINSIKKKWYYEWSNNYFKTTRSEILKSWKNDKAIYFTYTITSDWSQYKQNNRSDYCVAAITMIKQNSIGYQICGDKISFENGELAANARMTVRELVRINSY